MKRLKIATLTTPVSATLSAFSECKTGSFVKLEHLKLAGLMCPSECCFIRKAWEDLWSQLVSGKCNYFLTGPPGTGKSCLVWAWCCWKSQTAPVRWIHIDPAKDVWMVDLSAGKLTAVRHELGELDSLIKYTDAPILVVDGLTVDQKNLTGILCIWWQSNPQMRRLVLVTSLQFGWSQEVHLRLELETIISVGWTLEEYSEACKDTTFYNAVLPNLDADPSTTDPEELISAKFFLAGASARCMFTFNTEQLRKEITWHISRVENWQLLLAGLRGNRSSFAVNHLITTFDTTPNARDTLVSEFVARKIAVNCESSFIIEVTNMLSILKNPSFDGWVFQMDFLHRLNSRGKMGRGTIVFTNSNEHWIIPSFPINFFNEDELETLLKGSTNSTLNNAWFLPTKVNQGCYDILQLVGTVLCVVQLTVA